MSKQKRVGFTIVELLIVIVVIAILAAISVVAYNGVQTRARNTMSIDTVAKYYRALTLYATEQGGYPFSDATVYYCLGHPYPQGNCGAQSGTAWNIGTAGNNDTFNNLIRPYMGGQLPITMKDYITSESGVGVIGAYYQSSNRSIRYAIQDTSCPTVQGVTSSRIGGDSRGSLCQVILPAV